ncbi:TonB-dependent receptor plug domain-containing protein [Vibrio olivae]
MAGFTKFHPLFLAVLAGLSAQAHANDALTSTNNSTSQTSNSADDSQDTVTVYGRALSVYRAQQASLATKTATDIDDTPQSIQVLPQQLIEDQGARQVTDLYRSISGVSQYSYSGVTFRGFRQDEILYDGMRGDPFNGFAIPQLFNIEQVEVLKGPSAAISGSGEPGGVINYTTKNRRMIRSESCPSRRVIKILSAVALSCQGPRMMSPLSVTASVFIKITKIPRVTILTYVIGLSI